MNKEATTANNMAHHLKLHDLHTALHFKLQVQPQIPLLDVMEKYEASIITSVIASIILTLSFLVSFFSVKPFCQWMTTQILML